MSEGPQLRLDTDGVRQMAAALRRGWMVVLAVAVLVGVVALGYSLAQTPQYQSDATLYVTSGDNDNTNAAYTGGQAAQQRVASYTKLVTSDVVLDQALRADGLGISKSDARKALSATASTSTVLLTITATDSDKNLAANLVNSVSNAMTSYVQRLETSTGGGQPLAKLTLVTYAVPASSPVTPKTTRNVAVGAILGLVLGVLLVLARARFTSRVRTESDIQSATEIPVLGIIPSDRGLHRQKQIDFSSGATPAAEAFRKLRTNLAYTGVDRPSTVLLVTSAMAVEGKTTTAMNLAAASAEAGSRTVLVDADLRRPQVDARTGVVGSVGLTDVLLGKSDAADVVQESSVDRLWVIASGPQPPNPAELLGSGRMRTALADLSKHFDVVVVDSPPVLPVADAVVLSEFVDGVLLVARAGTTKMDDLGEAVEQVTVGQASVRGFVLTEAKLGSARYAYYGPQRQRRKVLRSR